MAHSVVDLAALLGVLIGEDYSSTVLKSFSGHKVAFADPMRWIAPPVAIPLVPELLKYQVRGGAHLGSNVDKPLQRGKEEKC